MHRQRRNGGRDARDPNCPKLGHCGTNQYSQDPYPKKKYSGRNTDDKFKFSKGKIHLDRDGNNGQLGFDEETGVWCFSTTSNNGTMTKSLLTSNNDLKITKELYREHENLAKRLTNPAEALRNRIAPKRDRDWKRDGCRHTKKDKNCGRPLNEAGAKALEMIWEEKILHTAIELASIKQIENVVVRALFLGEAPGGFMEMLNKVAYQMKHLKKTGDVFEKLAWVESCGVSKYVQGSERGGDFKHIDLNFACQAPVNTSISWQGSTNGDLNDTVTWDQTLKLCHLWARQEEGVHFVMCDGWASPAYTRPKCGCVITNESTNLLNISTQEMHGFFNLVTLGPGKKADECVAEVMNTSWEHIPTSTWRKMLQGAPWFNVKCGYVNIRIYELSWNSVIEHDNGGTLVNKRDIQNLSLSSLERELERQDENKEYARICEHMREENYKNDGSRPPMLEGTLAYDVQEEQNIPLVFAEMILGMLCLETRGTLVCKIFSVNTPTMTFILQWILCYFESMDLIKPIMSRTASDERYVIFFNRKSLEKREKESILSFSKKLHAKFMSEVYEDGVPKLPFHNIGNIAHYKNEIQSDHDVHCLGSKDATRMMTELILSKHFVADIFEKNMKHAESQHTTLKNCVEVMKYLKTSVDRGVSVRDCEHAIRKKNSIYMSEEEMKCKLQLWGVKGQCSVDGCFEVDFGHGKCYFHKSQKRALLYEMKEKKCAKWTFPEEDYQCALNIAADEMSVSIGGEDRSGHFFCNVESTEIHTDGDDRPVEDDGDSSIRKKMKMSEEPKPAQAENNLELDDDDDWAYEEVEE